MTQQINLLNPALRPQKKAFSATAATQALAAIAAGVLAIHVFEVRQNRMLEAVLADTDQKAAVQRGQFERFLKELAGKGGGATLAEELTRAEERLRARRALLEDVKTGAGGNAEGYSSYLAALARRTLPGVWLTGIELGGKSNDLVIKGRVLDGELVPAYIGQLKQEEPFAGRSVSELRMAAKEAPPPAGQQAQGPRRFVEFFMSLPL